MFALTLILTTRLKNPPPVLHAKYISGIDLSIRITAIFEFGVIFRSNLSIFVRSSSEHSQYENIKNCTLCANVKKFYVARKYFI